MTAPRFPRVAVIGGGPAGMASAKALALEPNKFKAIDVYERRDRLGGIWYYFNTPKDNVLPPIPSTLCGDHEVVIKPGFILSMYTYLETNLQVKLMEYLNVPFEGGDFPPRTKVYDYLNEYAKTVPKSVNIKFNANVEEIEKVGDVWKVTSNGVLTEYDAVIVGNGHFDLPYIPDVPGLQEWNANRPNTVTHSKYFVTSDPYKGKTVLVVGNAWLGIDIAVQVGVVAKKVYVSARTPQKVTKIDVSLVEEVGVVAEFDHKNRRATLTDATSIENIDAIIYCTGYLYQMPFLKTYANLVTERVIKNLFHQVFYVEDPSILFVALQKGVVPMPLLELQAAMIARVYSGRMALPPTCHMRAMLNAEYEARGDKIHEFNYPLDVDLYRLYFKVLADRPGMLDLGLIPVYWDDDMKKLRSETKDLKLARIKEIFRWAEKLRKDGKPFTLAPHNEGKFGH